MCRFVAYLGLEPVVLDDILDKPENSLINQSRKARTGKLGLNADGFGIGWYNLNIANTAALYKSIQPAWNDHNLDSLATHIASHCFVGHVRASTVGDVNLYNCHPFSYKHYLFAHNGTIRGFNKIKRQFIQILDDEFHDLIQGQTDSEHFFALLIQLIAQCKNPSVTDYMAAFKETIKIINSLQDDQNDRYFSRINVVFTDGKQIVATRYVNDDDRNAITLHYSVGDHVDNDLNEAMMQPTKKQPGAVVIASEPLTDYRREWNLLPRNRFLLVDEKLNIDEIAFEDA